MITEQNLKETTERFFSLYWNIEDTEYPMWSNHWYFKGTIPKNDKRGCYALYKNDEVIYIGVGIGKSFGKYSGSGLGDRLKRYWRINKTGIGNQYLPSDNWPEVTSISTICFDEKHYPLAAALEIYLIRELNPPKNRIHK